MCMKNVQNTKIESNNGWKGRISELISSLTLYTLLASYIDKLAQRLVLVPRVTITKHPIRMLGWTNNGPYLQQTGALQLFMDHHFHQT